LVAGSTSEHEQALSFSSVFLPQDAVNVNSPPPLSANNFWRYFPGKAFAEAAFLEVRGRAGGVAPGKFLNLRNFYHGSGVSSQAEKIASGARGRDEGHVFLY
jgi:hypothetical protein